MARPDAPWGADTALCVAGTGSFRVTEPVPAAAGERTQTVQPGLETALSLTACRTSPPPRAPPGSSQAGLDSGCHSRPCELGGVVPSLESFLPPGKRAYGPDRYTLGFLALPDCKGADTKGKRVGESVTLLCGPEGENGFVYIFKYVTWKFRV